MSLHILTVREIGWSLSMSLQYTDSERDWVVIEHVTAYTDRERDWVVIEHVTAYTDSERDWVVVEHVTAIY